MHSRRNFIRTLAAGAGGWRSIHANADAWAQVPAILEGIRPPSFPHREFDVALYGARGDGFTDCTDSFRAAIVDCVRAGGGRIFVPPGKFLTGPIHLKSNINLVVSDGAIVRFSQDPRKYLPVVHTRWEGIECMSYSPFIYAYEQQNIAITGGGILDGQADCEHWWPWKGRTECGWKKGDPSQQQARTRLGELGEAGVPVEKRVFGTGSFLRPQFIQPYNCRNVLIEGVTIRNSPMYEIHPVLCRSVMIRDVKIASHGPNNDGCDPESCRDVWIQNCEFDTGDDCIAIKSGRNQDGRRVATPSENIIIQGCVMKDGHGGVTIGSEVSGNVRNVFAEDCRMDSPNLERMLRIKTNAVRGGVIENVYVRKVQVGQVSDAVVQVDFYYEEAAAGPHKPVVRNIQVSDVTCKKSKYALSLRGFPEAPIRDVRLERCTFENVASANVVENVRGLALSGVKINGAAVSAP